MARRLLQILAFGATCAIVAGCSDSSATGGGGLQAADDAGDSDVFLFGSDASDTSTATADTSKDQLGAACTSDADCGGLSVGPCQKAICGAASICVAQAKEAGTACDDANACTSGDQCKGGACVGAGKDCNDQNPCTSDSCDPSSGQCGHSNLSIPCDDGDQCTQNDACQGGTCSGTVNPSCSCQKDADCAKTDDADLCNGIHTCQGGQCLTQAGSAVVCDTTQAKACEAIACDPTDGKCKASPLADASLCDDGDACTKGDACSAGACSGSAIACDDNNACTADSCDKAKGCVHTANQAACDDGDLCTTGDTCTGGSCVGTSNPGCAKCTATADCAKYEDGNLCNGTLSCQSGACVVDQATIVACKADANACKANTCVPATGACELGNLLDGTLCDDGDACSTGDHCNGGACMSASQLKCDDKNPCTTDTCDKASGCQFAPADGAACDDGDPCTGKDACAGGMCKGPATGACAKCAVDADCAAYDDADLCNGALSCQNGSCSINPATVVVCDTAGLSPCVSNTCVAATGKCVKANLTDGSTCDDSNACTEKDYCSKGVCKGKPVYCDDGQFCTDDSCNPDTGCQHSFNDSACDDGNSCTQNDTCKAGSCGGTPVEACSCQKSSDCSVYEDGDACNGTLVCAGSKCVVDPKTLVTCDPGKDPCTTAACNPKTGLCAPLATGDGKSCDDKSACTSGETCANGKCQGGAPVPCDDKNPCTDDSCNPDFGCTFLANSAACDDGDTCTGGDTCANSQCQPGKTNSCPSACAAAWTLGCGQNDGWSNGGSGSTNVVTSYACNPGDAGQYTGPEFAYLYTAPFDGELVATLSNETDQTDVFILAQGNTGCDAATCVAWDYASAKAQVKAGQTYYIVVDGWQGANGKYALAVTCTPAHETSCQDGLDDDADGKTDCDDSDCTAAASCADPVCVPDLPLACGSIDKWSTAYGGTTDALASYQGCNNPYKYPAPEYSYAFKASVSGAVQVWLSAKSAEMDILILSDNGQVCAANNCLASDLGTGSVTFNAVAGTTYYVVIDGYNGAIGAYTLHVDCLGSTETCSGGIDEDADGATDCEDSDCFGVSDLCQPACSPDTAELATLTCAADKDYFSNNGSGSTNVVTGYGCNPALPYTGSEYAYTYVATSSGSVSVSLANETAETDILVLEDTGLGCNPASCIASGVATAQFQAVAGVTYYIVIDGYQGANGSYDLAFTCP